jgi:DNA invertase Pin-like site-specific DNA recombinase
MKIGYARVSSNSQDLELQKEELLKAGCEKIFSESISGKDNNRTELIKMISILREKDVVVVYKIDRIARSLKGLIDIIETLKDKKVDLVSLDFLDKVDTTSPMGKAFFQIVGVIAELERGMINARTKAGIEKAKLNGVKFGRRKGELGKKTAEIEPYVVDLLMKKVNWITIQRTYNIAAKTVQKIKERNGIQTKLIKSN